MRVHVHVPRDLGICAISRFLHNLRIPKMHRDYMQINCKITWNLRMLHLGICKRNCINSRERQSKAISTTGCTTNTRIV